MQVSVRSGQLWMERQVNGRVPVQCEGAWLNRPEDRWVRRKRLREKGSLKEAQEVMRPSV